MTKEEARIILLENELRQAQHTIAFLHGCLTNPGEGGYLYAYPEQTIQRLEKMAELVPLLPMCFHSMYKLSCDSCVQNHGMRQIVVEARKVLRMEN